MTILYIHRTKGFLSGLSFILYPDLLDLHVSILSEKNVRIIREQTAFMGGGQNWSCGEYVLQNWQKTSFDRCRRKRAAVCFTAFLGGGRQKDENENYDGFESSKWPIRNRNILIDEILKTLKTSLTKDKLWQLPPRAGNLLFPNFFWRLEAKYSWNRSLPNEYDENDTEKLLFFQLNIPFIK